MSSSGMSAAIIKKTRPREVAGVFETGTTSSICPGQVGSRYFKTETAPVGKRMTRPGLGETRSLQARQLKETEALRNNDPASVVRICHWEPMHFNGAIALTGNDIIWLHTSLRTLVDNFWRRAALRCGSHYKQLASFPAEFWSLPA